jgi:hypothetical protein
MTMQWFDFGGSETFHFFKWVIEAGHVNADDLIDQAFKATENDPMLAMGIDGCHVLRDKLAEILDDVLQGTIPGFVRQAMDDGPFLGDMEHRAYPLNSLWLPLFANVVRRIECKTVAHALLMRAGKWTPGKRYSQR